ncbi:MAG: hypothetical protein AOA65_2075 [Candidatus Bathyarchaeota archaeon BA1]|nr:MAG: hypothetical protein AOA65_2075 [Candidatus Bathyarchaeota archaeon BA1]
MSRFDLNSAKVYVGHNVNLHLKDGSVIINVLITHIHREHHDRNIILCCSTPKKRTMKIHLSEVDWAERLDPHLLRYSQARG